jgi:hypothetical protein
MRGAQGLQECVGNSHNETIFAGYLYSCLIIKHVNIDASIETIYETILASRSRLVELASSLRACCDRRTIAYLRRYAR